MAATTTTPSEVGRRPVGAPARLRLARALDRWATLSGLAAMVLAAVGTVVLG